jgi:hypothetical protein
VGAGVLVGAGALVGAAVGCGAVVAGPAVCRDAALVGVLISATGVGAGGALSQALISSSAPHRSIRRRQRAVNNGSCIGVPLSFFSNCYEWYRLYLGRKYANHSIHVKNAQQHLFSRAADDNLNISCSDRTYAKRSLACGSTVLFLLLVGSLFAHRAKREPSKGLNSRFASILFSMLNV